MQREQQKRDEEADKSNMGTSTGLKVLYYYKCIVWIILFPYLAKQNSQNLIFNITTTIKEIKVIQYQNFCNLDICNYKFFLFSKTPRFL